MWPRLELTMKLMVNLSSLSSCLYFPSAGAICLHHHVWSNQQVFLLDDFIFEVWSLERWHTG